MAEKMDGDRIREIYKLCKGHFGDVKFVGIKYHSKMGWIAIAQLGDDLENLTADGETKKVTSRVYPKKEFYGNEYVVIVIKEITNEA